MDFDAPPDEDAGAGRRIRAEAEIIGSILREPSLYGQVRFLIPADFANPDHAQIWATVREHVEQNLEVTPARLAAGVFLSHEHLIEDLHRTASGNSDQVSRLARRLVENRRRSQVLDVLQGAIGAIRDRDTPWTETVNKTAHALTDVSVTGRATTANEVNQRLIRRLERQNETVIPTGLNALDRALGGGLRNSTLILVGAYAKTGKTVLVATVSHNLEVRGTPHLAISLERRDEDLEALKAARLVGCNANRLSDHVAKVRGLPERKRSCHYLHDSQMGVEDIRHEILFHKRRFGIRAALIDYWQLIEGRQKGESVENHRTRVAQVVQKTSVDADIPIIMTCQLSDNGGSRDSPAAKTAANLFLILHRDKGEVDTWMETVSSNITDETDIGGVGSPQFVLNKDEGPHFANADP